MKIYTQNIGGNVHEAADLINKLGLAEWLVHLSSPTGLNCIGVFRVSDEHYEELTKHYVDVKEGP